MVTIASRNDGQVSVEAVDPSAPKRNPLLFSFELVTSLLEKDVRFLVTDGSRTYKFVARKGLKRHYYINIPVSATPTIKFNSWCQVNVLSYSDDFFLTDQQETLNAGIIADGLARYKKEVCGVPTSAIISFPHFKGPGGHEAPYTLLDGAQYGFDNTLHLSFQDAYLSSGSYFLSGNHGEDPMPDVVRVIEKELALHGLQASDATFLGSSKGSNSAALASSFFSGNELIVCAYATDLDHFLGKTLYAFVAEQLRFFGKETPDFNELLFGQAEHKDVHWFYSTSDEVSNCGNETRNAGRLTKHAIEEPHSKVLASSQEEITGLLTRLHGPKQPVNL